MLDQVGVQLKAVSDFRKDFLPERQEGATVVPTGTGRAVLEGGGYWHGKWRLPGPDCLGGWGGLPSGDGVGGRDAGGCTVSKAV